MMVPELHPPSPAKKFFTKMAKSLFGKKKSKGERPLGDAGYVRDPLRFIPPLFPEFTRFASPCSGEDSM